MPKARAAAGRRGCAQAIRRGWETPDVRATQTEDDKTDGPEGQESLSKSLPESAD
jgi:hypothetical protein